MNLEMMEILVLNKLRQEAIKFLSGNGDLIVSENEIKQAVQLMTIGYSIAAEDQIRRKSNSKIQNSNIGIILSEWGQTS
jgi:hypothetical protein